VHWVTCKPEHGFGGRRDPLIVNARDLKNYSSEDAPKMPLPEGSRQLLQPFTRYAKAHPNTAFVSYSRADGSFELGTEFTDMTDAQRQLLARYILQRQQQQRRQQLEQGDPAS
jgi:hypothetical protein